VRLLCAVGLNKIDLDNPDSKSWTTNYYLNILKSRWFIVYNLLPF